MFANVTDSTMKAHHDMLHEFCFRTFTLAVGNGSEVLSEELHSIMLDKVAIFASFVRRRRRTGTNQDVSQSGECLALSVLSHHVADQFAHLFPFQRPVAGTTTRKSASTALPPPTPSPPSASTTTFPPIAPTRKLMATATRPPTASSSPPP